MGNNLDCSCGRRENDNAVFHYSKFGVCQQTLDIVTRSWKKVAKGDTVGYKSYKKKAKANGQEPVTPLIHFTKIFFELLRVNIPFSPHIKEGFPSKCKLLVQVLKTYSRGVEDAAETEQKQEFLEEIKNLIEVCKYNGLSVKNVDDYGRALMEAVERVVGEKAFDSKTNGAWGRVYTRVSVLLPRILAEQGTSDELESPTTITMRPSFSRKRSLSGTRNHNGKILRRSSTLSRIDNQVLQSLMTLK